MAEFAAGDHLAETGYRLTREWIRHPLHQIKLAKARHDLWRRLFPGDRADPLEKLSIAGQADALRATELILAAHRHYLSEFNVCTARAQEIFETRDWERGVQNAEYRTSLYRTAVNGVWQAIEQELPNRQLDAHLWIGARQLLLECVFDEYEADLALTFFYSVMRLAFDELDVPVEYADDGLSDRPHMLAPDPVWYTYRAREERLSRAVEQALKNCGLRAPFENAERDAELVAERLLSEWRRLMQPEQPHRLEMLKPIFFRDQEAYLVGRLCSGRAQLPVVFALKNDERGISIEAVLVGKEDMRNILFVSTRSTFQVHTREYREVLDFVDSLAPERGHPAMCAVIGFTHPARVALNQRLRLHLEHTGERFATTPGRVGMAMIVFSPPSFPYVFKVIRDTSPKAGWSGRARIMDLYRWVHEMNRGRLMLDAWIYRNLHFPRQYFEASVLEELLARAPSSVRLDGNTIVLKTVYAQRRVLPLNTFFDQTSNRALRERAIDALGTFIKDLARMGFFVGDHYGLTFNTGLTHAFNVTLFDFDDLGSLLNYRFRQTPELNEKDELLWNSEIDGPWFSVEENDVLVDEWERFLGVPPDLKEHFRQKHGDLFTLDYWTAVQYCVTSGELHYVNPYPPELRLLKENWKPQDVEVSS